MSKIDNIYASLDDFGLITSKEAATIGVSNAELVQIADRGKLTRVARGVYRATAWPYQEALPYAIAVKSAGEQAYLYGESVIALLNLVYQPNP
jgi:predicted transcriptional regulator of viral defense system